MVKRTSCLGSNERVPGSNPGRGAFRNGGDAMLSRNFSPDVVALGDRLAALSVVQAALLNKYLAEVHGIEAPDSPVGELTVRPDQVVEPTPTPADEFDVVLESYDAPRKIVLIKGVRELFGLGIKEASELVN